MRSVNKVRFDRCVELRKQGFSYSEIMQDVKVAKSTLQGWLSESGLVLAKEHFEIQAKKRFENYRLYGVEASRLVRKARHDKVVSEFVYQAMKWIKEPLFILGVMAYQAEGSKSGSKFEFSNSDYRMVLVFMAFIKKYLSVNVRDHMRFRLYIHETRSEDLERIIEFWSKKLAVPKSAFSYSWKRNIVTAQRYNLDYVGQMSLHVIGGGLLTHKILAISSIIMSEYCGVV